MAEFRYNTRGRSTPQGKPSVYFTCHPQDFARYFDEIRDDILERVNCAVFYLDPKTSPEEVADYELRLREMQLFVVPVTTKLLTTPNRAMDIDVPFAIENHIPILPLMQAEGLDDTFNRKFGDIQYLCKLRSDPTEVPYGEKLTRYLESVIVGDDIAEQIRAAFDAYIFLSYRKKDRRYAQELMRLIHSNPLCRDFAIWYDEFLTPGEDFNDAIRAALEKSGLFALAVTPNLVKENNYIQEHEFPMARDLGKKILPVEMVPTGGFRFKRMYKGCPKPISFKQKDALNEQLIGMLRDLARSCDGKDASHTFLIGLAYLQGIDVEVNKERAVRLITEAADNGCIPAVRKLVNIYFNGEGVRRDVRKACDYLIRLRALCEEDYLAAPDEEKACDLLQALWSEADGYEAYAQYDASHAALEKMDRYSGEFLEKYDYLTFAGMRTMCLRALSRSEEKQHRPELQEKYARLAVEIDEEIAQKTGRIPDRQAAAEDYRILGSVAKSRGKLDEAEEWYRKSLDICAAIAEKTGESDDREIVSSCYCDLGAVAEDKGELSRAEEYYRKALEIDEALSKDKNAETNRRSLASTYLRLGRLHYDNNELRKAGEWYFKALEIAKRNAESTDMIIDRIFLADCFKELGDTYIQSRMANEADQCYRMYLKIMTSVHEETGTLDATVRLAHAYFKMGDVHTLRHQFAEAEKWYLKSVGLQEEILRQAETPETLRSLSLSCGMLANLAQAQGNRREGVHWYRKSIAIDEKLAELIGTPESYDDLAASYYNLGAQTADLALVDKALEMWRDLVRRCPEVPLYRRRVSETEQAREQLLAYLARQK